MTHVDIRPILTRTAISAIFIWSGLNKLLNQTETIAYIEYQGLPFPVLAMWGAAGLELVGGLSLIVGYRLLIAAAALAVFSLMTALIFHRAIGDENQLVHFMKNISMAGGLFSICLSPQQPAPAANRPATARA